MSREITGVLGVLNKLELTKTFINKFRADFPDIPLAIGALGCNEETVGYLKDLEANDNLVTVHYGEKDKQYSFSENYNVAINLVKTPKLVLIHNDMVFHKDFFNNLERDLTDPGTFLLYTTVEPLENAGFTRPGKSLGDFGHGFDDFKEKEFTDYVERLISTKTGLRRHGYGFFLSGFTESFKDVGGFDFESFRPSFCEDDDLQVRLKSKGYWIEVSTQSYCYHFVSQTSRSTFQTGMSHLEIRSNRFFGRKWGFEARFLWKTGYEQVQYLKVKDWVILGKPLGAYNTLNMEPLVDYLVAPKDLNVDAFVKNELRTPEDEPRIRGKFVETDEKADIVVTQEGPENFTVLSDLVGYLRLSGTDIHKGTFKIGPYNVEIRKDSSEVGFREDPKNYLSMLQN